MSPVAKVSEFHREGNDWFCKTGLSSDTTVVVDDVKFHLHKFPLVSKCGKLARMYEESKSIDKKSLWTIVLEEFPGGSDTFLIVARFCYRARVDFTAKNLVSIHCAAEYLEMTNEYGEDNLISQVETFLHKHVLRNWKDCILALQSSTPVLKSAEKLQMIPKLMNAVSTMVCTDPSLFGWPMMMYGTLQSPGGSILWNGINTGARMRSSGSDWWYEDISYLSVDLFKRLIKMMETKGIRAESLAGAMMYYARKYLPGLGRWQSGTSSSSKSRRRVVSFSLAPSSSSSSSMSPVDQIALLETILSLLPEKRGRSFCKFLLGLLRVAFILGVDGNCVKMLERRIGMQLELATLENLLILNYSDSETLYNVDCVERIIRHFVSSPSSSSELTEFSPPSLDPEMSPSSSAPLRKVAKLVDSYMAEVASDVNLKPDKMRSLAAALPESSRPLYDGLYRAFDIYFKEHPWLSDRDKEQLCNIMDYQRLSIDACAHASHNDRLPLRVVLQVLFFEQMHLRTALVGSLNVANTEIGHALTIPGRTGQEIVQRDGWVTIVRQNQVLKVDMQKMRSRVGELEEEFQSIKQEMKKRVGSLSSPRLVKIGCKFLLPRASDAKNDTVQNSVTSTPRSVATNQELPRSSRHSKHRKSFSFFG
ncbi:BTB/POZ domain-containing protein [Cardamine amara subsp. amara]|uniref:BTB/POZ domain-containing protein n=1 Tax=Cardamine amara subsp. amara TaxID=228776 RepID=A0ABD1A217_CARAN